MCPYTLISSCLSPESWIIIKWSGRSSGSGFAAPSHSAKSGIVDLQQLRNGWINRVSFLFSIHYSPFSFLYSYGDSTGLTPDFPFNLPHEAGEPNQGKNKLPDINHGKSYQQRGLICTFRLPGGTCRQFRRIVLSLQHVAGKKFTGIGACDRLAAFFRSVGRVPL